MPPILLAAIAPAKPSTARCAIIDLRWGEARRSRRDRSCWDGEDFRICVY